MTERPQWNSFRALSRRVLRNGEPLVLTEEVRSLLLKTAQEVAIRDADAALATDEGALALMHEATRRITEGSNRLTDALHVMWQHQRVGDYDSARKLMRDVLAVEVVPYYRELAQGQLEDMDDET